MTRGGKRPGAGRPRESRTLRARIQIEDADSVDLVAARDGVTVSDVLRRYVREGLERDEDCAPQGHIG